MSMPVMNGGPMVVVTHVQPVTMAAPVTPNHTFRNGYPLALGATQIVIGVVMLLSGVVMAIAAPTLGVYSGIFSWGALMYITAGSLTVTAGKYDSRCLVNGALGLSIVSVIVSLTAAVLYSLDAAGILSYCYNSSHSYHLCYQFMSLSQGFSGILAVLNIVMMAISLTVSGFACNTVCSCCADPLQRVNHVMVPQVPQVAQVPQFPQVPQVPQFPQVPQVPQVPQAPQVPQVPPQEPKFTAHDPPPVYSQMPDSPGSFLP